VGGLRGRFDLAAGCDRRCQYRSGSQNFGPVNALAPRMSQGAGIKI